jgi:thiamine-phosphate pyrophosphorylase
MSSPSHASTLAQARLYGIVDLGYVQPRAVVTMTRDLCQGGVDLLQLRAKNIEPATIESLSREMLGVTRDHGIPLIINDHPEIAASIGSDGVHVGQDDDSVARARQVVGPGIIVGKSTHSLPQAVAAQAEGADYIGFGPLYATGTKPDYIPVGLQDIAEVHRQVQIPIFCIGGVNQARIGEIISSGARRVVVVSAFLLAPDVQTEVRQLKAALP